MYQNENIKVTNNSISIRTPSNNVVISIDPRQIFIQEIVKECYDTHEILTNKEIEWAVQKTSLELLKDPESNGRWPLLVLFILHSCKNLQTGKLSFIYNFELDDAIKMRNEERLSKLLNLEPILRWQEKTKNDELDSDEQSELTEMRNKEMIVVMNVVAEGRNMKAPYIQKFLTNCCNDNKITKGDTSVYTSCYKGVCIQERNQKRHQRVLKECKGDICERIDMKNHDEIIAPDLSPEVIMIQIPQENSFYENELRCYDFNVILEALTQNPVIDPITKEELSSEIVDVLIDRYSKEIKMYKFYLNYLNNYR